MWRRDIIRFFQRVSVESPEVDIFFSLNCEVGFPCGPIFGLIRVGENNNDSRYKDHHDIIVIITANTLLSLLSMSSSATALSSSHCYIHHQHHNNYSHHHHLSLIRVGENNNDSLYKDRHDIIITITANTL